jgi:hypothetical protein
MSLRAGGSMNSAFEADTRRKPGGWVCLSPLRRATDGIDRLSGLQMDADQDPVGNKLLVNPPASWQIPE